MSPPPKPMLEIDTLAGVPVVAFADGNLQSEAIEALRRETAVATDGGPGTLLLNFAAVRRLEIDALGLLVRLARKRAAERGRLALCNVRPGIARLLTGPPRLTRFAPIYASREEALEQMAVAPDPQPDGEASGESAEEPVALGA